MPVLEAVRRDTAKGPVKGGPVLEMGTRGPGVTETLLAVLGSIGSYDAGILEAERGGDEELAGFLRELRRQDVVRAKGATRLLRRPHEDAHGRR